MDASPDSRELRDRTAAIRRGQLLGHNAVLIPALFGGIILGTVLGAAMWKRVPHPSIAEWALALAFALVIRAAVGFSFRRVCLDPGENDREAWLWRIRATYFLHGSVWGLAPLLMFPANDVPGQIIVAFACTTVAVGALSVAAFDLIGASTFAVPALAPLIVRLLTSGGEVNLFISLLLVLFLGYVRMSALRAHRDSLENALLRADEEVRTRSLIRQKEFLEALHQTTLDLLGREDLDDLLRAVAARAASILDASCGELSLKEGDVLTVRATAGDQPRTEGARRDRGQAPLSWQVCDTLKPVVVDQYSAVAGVAPIDAAHPLEAVAEFPILLGEVCLGVLSLGRFEPGRTFSAEEIERGQMLAQHAALVVHNAGIYADALREAEARTVAIRQFRAALDQSTDAVYLIDPSTGRFIDFNETAHARLGYTREEHLALTLKDVETERPEIHQWRGHLERLRKAGQLTFEGVHRRKDGTTFPVELNVRYIKGPPQDYLVAIVRDISERRQTEAALRESEERFHAVFDHSPIIVGLMSVPEGRVVEMNEASLIAFGYTREEALGKTTAELGVWVNLAERDVYISRLRTDGSVTGQEVMMRRRDGSVFPALYSGRLIQIGGRAFSLNTVQDITLRKRAEKSLSELNAELENKVLERTKALDLAVRQAEQANQAKSQFLANMSHEIRTPLNGVLGMIDILRQTTLKAQQAQMADLAHESATSLLSIIEDVLDFSKIEAGMVELERRPMSIAREVEKSCELLDQAAAKKGVELTLFTDPALPAMVKGDAIRIRQVLHNIAGNAIKFSSAQAHPRRVAVRALLVEDRGDKAQIGFEVRDNGIGMDEATLARLFNSFTQADPSITRRFGGTGLGLSISRNLTRLMGGDIQVQSRPGQGSTFTVTLPVEKVEAPAAESFDRGIAGLRCLVVGPSAALAPDLSAYLTASGARVQWVEDLDEARAFVRGRDPGPLVVVVDEGDGPVAPDEVRAAAAAGKGETTFLLIGRGRRRRPRKMSADLVEIDGNVMARQTFSRAVSMAAGTYSEDALPETARDAATTFAPAAAPQRGQAILVAEDNRVNQIVIQQQLKSLGYAADVVSHGRDALARFAASDYALVITDLQMPEMDGYELTTAIRALEKESGREPVPIVALTANALKDEAERCRSVGMNDYLTKPAGLLEVKAVLEKWLPAHEEGDQAAHPGA